MGITSDDGFIARGTGGDEFGIPYPYDFLADGGGKPWGFVTRYTEPDPGFVVGCMAIGQEIGVQGWAGSFESGLAGNAYWGKDGLRSGHAGPAGNAYWDKAGVVGWSPQFTGVAGTTSAALRPGVYGQSGDARGVPEGVNAGVFGASGQAVGVRGWSAINRGVAGESDTSIGVWGASQRQYGVLGQTGDFPFGPRVTDPNNPGAGDKDLVPAGVCGTATDAFGVAGSSLNASGVLGQSGPAPAFDPNLNYTGGVVGTSRDAVGVVAVSQNSYGVVARSQNSFGVITASQNSVGVVAYSQNGAGVAAGSQEEAGVYALSGTNSGVVAISGAQGPTVPNTSNIAAVVGTSDRQHGVIGTSNASVGVIGFSNNIGIFGYATTPGSLAGYFLGNVKVDGTLTATAKNAVVRFPDGSERVLHCMESPEHWFEDFGAAKLKRGRAMVKLDADFAKVIRRGDYKVFLTPEGDCKGLYVHKRGDSFEVRELQSGTSRVAFSYRVVGKRKDIKAHKRFAKIDMPPSFPTAVNAPGKVRSTEAGLRVFVARLERQARRRRPKVAKKGRRSRGRPK